MNYVYWYVAIGCVLGLYTVRQITQPSITEEDKAFNNLIDEEMKKANVTPSNEFLAFLMILTIVFWPVAVAFAIVCKIILFFFHENEEK